jgi:hypothetical protein
VTRSKNKRAVDQMMKKEAGKAGKLVRRNHKSETSPGGNRASRGEKS